MNAILPSVANGSFDFVASNLHLFGFDDAQQAIVQSVRELVDNSVDACRQVPAGHISVTIDASLPEWMSIEVSDNGIGMDDIAQHFQLFITQTNAQQLGRIGKYGIGLSATLIHAFTDSATPAQVISKVSGSNELLSAEISINLVHGTRMPRITSQRSIALSDLACCGTTIKLRLTNPGEAIMTYAGQVEEYLALICSNPTKKLHIDLDLRLGQHAAQHHAFSYRSPAANGFAGYARDHLIPHLSMNAHDAVHATCHAAGCSATVVMVAASSHTSADAQLHLLRHVNAKPLTDHADDSRCALAKALRQCKWSRHNLQLIVAADSGSLADGGIARQFQLQRCQQDEDVNDASGLQLFAYVYYESASVTYADMKKSSVHKLPVDHSKLITKAANECLHQLSTIPLAARWFQSPEQVQELARKKQVEQLAVSVGRMVQFSKDQDLKRWALDHFAGHNHAVLFDYAMMDDAVDGAAEDDESYRQLAAGIGARITNALSAPHNGAEEKEEDD